MIRSIDWMLYRFDFVRCRSRNFIQFRDKMHEQCMRHILNVDHHHHHHQPNNDHIHDSNRVR
ncbi:hypothetical protein DERF_001149 [Dermatophagoides farinae]|uniref:Uncharacterized protein n=1 Tax=Dermatophagoides farinae TaxID=6954 RepID=A0A922IBA8_DERFA|nr:hypothetical protein DERF_001149 [Dermatophagoides farinae]